MAKIDAVVDARCDRTAAAHKYWITIPSDERQACHVAGVALYLYGELPEPDDEHPHGRNTVNAAHYILPGQCYLTPPEDREEFAVRVGIAQALVADAGGAEDSPGGALLKIAADALDVLAGLLTPDPA